MSNALCLILGVCCRHHKSASKSRLRSQAFSRSSQGRLRRASSAGNSKLAYSQVRTPVWRTIFFSGSRFCEQKNSNCMDLLQRFVSHMGHFEWNNSENPILVKHLVFFINNFSSHQESVQWIFHSRLFVCLCNLYIWEDIEANTVI